MDYRINFKNDSGKPLTGVKVVFTANAGGSPIVIFTTGPESSLVINTETDGALLSPGVVMIASKEGFQSMSIQGSALQQDNDVYLSAKGGNTLLYVGAFAALLYGLSQWHKGNK